MGFSNDKNQYLNTTVHNKSYNEFKSINSVIYCDPPYSDTAGYSVGKFNHEEFYDWVRNESKNNIVLISEFKAPEDFICIYSFEFTQGAGNSARVTEKVFTHKSALKNEIIKELYEKENSKVKTEQLSLF